jgi:hypothetical protein
VTGEVHDVRAVLRDSIQQVTGRCRGTHIELDEVAVRSTAARIRFCSRLTRRSPSDEAASLLLGIAGGLSLPAGDFMACFARLLFTAMCLPQLAFRRTHSFSVAAAARTFVAADRLSASLFRYSPAFFSVLTRCFRLLSSWCR